MSQLSGVTVNSGIIAAGNGSHTGVQLFMWNLKRGYAMTLSWFLPRQVDGNGRCHNGAVTVA